MTKYAQAMLIACCGISAIRAGKAEQDALFKAVTSTTKEEKKLQSLLNLARARYVQALRERNVTQLLAGTSWDGAAHVRRAVSNALAKELASHFLQIKQLDNALKEQYEREAFAVRNLLASGRADVNAVDEKHRTPLYLAIIHDKPGMLVDVLLQAGAQLFVGDREQPTPQELVTMYCLIDKDLDIPLTSRMPRRFGDPANVKRSCWISERLALQRHNALGGSSAFFNWLSKGAQMLAFIFPSHRDLSRALRNTEVQEMLGDLLVNWEI